MLIFYEKIYLIHVLTKVFNLTQYRILQQDVFKIELWKVHICVQILAQIHLTSSRTPRSGLLY